MSGKAEPCKWCHEPMREETVLVGPPPGRPVQMFIDVEPHEGGRVVARSDGQFRMLAPYARDHPTRPVFRVHGARSCGPDAPPPRVLDSPR